MFGVELHVASFDLWWPRGYGRQPLYDIEVEVKSGSETIGIRQARIGFRTVEFTQRAHPEKGSYFIIEVNGTKVFAKGANFVPADLIFARIDKARYTKLVELAEEANFNLLRVWGGGLYESDDFYTLCDERGFLVWQEFCFSCTRYPGNDPEFVQSVEKEAIYQARRLAPHPSLVAWCGNNEIQMQCELLHDGSKCANLPRVRAVSDDRSTNGQVGMSVCNVFLISALSEVSLTSSRNVIASINQC